MDNLIEVLEEENKQYENLVELSKRKKQVIVEANVKKLEDITSQEQDVTSTLANLDNKRDSIFKDIADVLGKDVKEMTITKLIGYLEKQPEEQVRLQQIREKLITTGEEMNGWNEKNDRLLKQALEMVEFDLTLFKSMRQAPETANYDKNAYNTGDLLANSGFDAKQ